MELPDTNSRFSNWGEKPGSRPSGSWRPVTLTPLISFCHGDSLLLPGRVLWTWREPAVAESDDLALRWRAGAGRPGLEGRFGPDSGLRGAIGRPACPTCRWAASITLVWGVQRSCVANPAAGRDRTSG